MPGATLGAVAGPGTTESVVRTVLPAPVTFAGMPSPRWWELEDAAVYLIFFETAAGGRAFTNGWLFADGALQDTVDAVEHDLELDGTLVERGTFDVTWSSGRRMAIAFQTRSRCYLAGIGYAVTDEVHQHFLLGRRPHVQ